MCPKMRLANSSWEICLNNLIDLIFVMLALIVYKNFLNSYFFYIQIIMECIVKEIVHHEWYIWFLAIVNITGAVEKANKKCTASCICAIKNYILLSCYTNVAYYFSVSQKITYFNINYDCTSYVLLGFRNTKSNSLLKMFKIIQLILLR